jgi:hypothetical protein
MTETSAGETDPCVRSDPDTGSAGDTSDQEVLPTKGMQKHCSPMQGRVGQPGDKTRHETLDMTKTHKTKDTS